MAKDINDALRKEKITKVDDCFIDDTYKEETINQLTPAIGFAVEQYDED
jgi:hypothetical protein